MRVFVYSIHTPKWQFKCMNMGSLFVCYAYLFIFSRLLPLVSFECVVVVVVHVHVMTAKCFALSLLRLRVKLSFLILPFTAAHNKKNNKNLISIYHICMYICVQKKCMFLLFQYIDQSIKAGTKFNLVACPNIVIMKGLGPFVPYLKRR